MLTIRYRGTCFSVRSQLGRRSIVQAGTTHGGGSLFLNFRDRIPALCQVAGCKSGCESLDQEIATRDERFSVETHDFCPEV